MLRSLYSGISGMKNFQTKLDVIGNNIANVNTAGFKKSRVTFKDTMNQTMAGASASTAVRGGKNAMQVGLGSTLATIDTITTGSSLQTTNRPLDLGIDGDGYFIVRQGDQQFYTRAGNFYLDDNGTLVNADGLKVQAYGIDDNGKVMNTFGDVAVNVNAVLPPVTTTGLTFSENLSATANVGSTFSQQIKVVDKDGIPRATTIYFKKLSPDNWGMYTIKSPEDAIATTTGGLKLTDSGAYTGTAPGKWELRYTSTGYNLTIPGVATPIPLTLRTSDNKLVPSAADKLKLQGLELDVSAIENPASATVVASPSNGMSGNINITDPTTYNGTTDKQYTLTFTAGDPTIPTADSWGYVDATTGGTPTAITFDATGKSTTTIDGMQLDISDLGSPADGDTFTIDAKAKTPQPTAIIPPATTAAPIATINVTPATRPDHVLNFVNGRIPNGKNVFPINLAIPSGQIDDTDTVANESLQTLAGINFDVSKLTQLDGANTALINPDGNTEGKLDSFNIGSMGEINGVYSNGQIKTLGQLALAKFSNASGLTKAGGNLFQETVNSGTPDVNVAGDGRGSIQSGSLEMSNVDLSEEFTEMITAQRGFQANTRIITTSDEILQELVNLKH